MIKLALTEHAPAMPQCLLINKEEVKMNMNSPAEYRGFANVDEGSYRGIRVTAKRLRGPFGHGVGTHHWLERSSYLILVRISTRSTSSENCLPGELFLMATCCPSSVFMKIPGPCT